MKTQIQARKARAAWLIERYGALVEHARELAFPRVSTSRLAPQDTSSWPRLCRWAYKVAAPFSWTAVDRPDIVSLLVLLVWWIATWYWLTFAWLGLQFAAGNVMLTQEPNLSMPIPPTKFLTSPGWIALDLLAPTSYWNWGRFLVSDKRIGRKHRLAAVLSVSGLSIGFIVLVLFPQPDHRLVAILGSWRSVKFCVVVCLRFVVPMITFLSSGCLHMVSIIVLLFNNIGFAHMAFPKDKIEQLATGVIQAPDGIPGGCRLIDLEESDLNSLRDWASENREGSDKRLLPTVVTLAFIALFTDTEWFGGFLNGTIEFLKSALQPANGVVRQLEFRTILGQSLLILGLLLVLMLLSSLFSNLVVQSLIVEACIVAQHATGTEQEQPVKKPRPRSFLNCMWQLLCRE